jgi:hypothetical protein
MTMMMGDKKKEQMGWLSRMIESLVDHWFGIRGKQAKGLGAVDAGLGIGGCSIEDLIGVIILGVGDSCASVVGKRFGKIKWNVGSSKVSSPSLIPPSLSPLTHVNSMLNSCLLIVFFWGVYADGGRLSRFCWVRYRRLFGLESGWFGPTFSS